MNEHEIEPIPGLPERLPRGERIVWQGTPDWWSLALRALHVRGVAIYFVLLFVWSVGMGILDGASAGDATLVALRLLPVALVAIGLLSLYAWLVQRTTIYTITNRRVVMRFGIALPMALNLPYAQVEAAAVKAFSDGTGDIPLTLNETGRVSYFVLWPHARPWWVTKPQPMLRGIPDAVRVSALLANALAKATGGKAQAVVVGADAEAERAGSREPVAA